VNGSGGPCFSITADPLRPALEEAWNDAAMSTFGERLRRARVQAGLSQTGLAFEGVSASYISLLESGRRTASAQVVAQLAARLGVAAEYLLHGEPSDHDRRMELELAFCRLALEHGQGADARDRLRVLVAEDLQPAVRDQAELLLSRALIALEELDDAADLALPLLERTRAGHSTLPVSVVGNLVAWLHAQAGNDAQAVTAAEQALQACREQGLAGTEDYFRLACTLIWAYSNLGDHLSAATWARRALSEAEAAGSRHGQAVLYWNAAMLAEQRGRIDEALHLCRQAMAHLSELDDSNDLARVRVAAAAIMLVVDPPPVVEAVAALERTKDLLKNLGTTMDQVEWALVRSQAALLQDDLDTAETLAQSAVDQALAANLADVTLTARCQMALGDALFARGRAADAREQYRAATDALNGAPDTRFTAQNWRDLGERWIRLDDPRAAAEAFRRALTSAGVRDRTRTTLAAVAAAAAAGVTATSRRT